MIVNNKKFKLSITELLFVAIAIVYMIGIRGWFKVCEPMGDSFMSCHWAGEALKAISVLMLVLGLVHVFLPDAKLKLGMDIAFVGVLVLTLIIPGNVINLCKMEDMKCRSLTQTWNMILCIIWIIIVLADALVCLANANKEKHQRA